MQIPRFVLVVPFVASVFAACGDEAPPVSHVHLSSCDHELVAMPAASEDLGGKTTSTLAIRKDVLDSAWLPSSSADGAAGLSVAANEMIWLRQWKDRVFVFVAGPPLKPGVSDPPAVRAAYRIVDRPDLAGVAGADRYLFVEISAP